MDYIGDTSFLIGLWRRRAEGPERRFIDRHADAVLVLPWIAKAEFLRGAVLARHDPGTVTRFLSDYPVAWPSDLTLEIYARTWAALAGSRQMIGVHDLWIAASALEHRLPVLTGNAPEFRRVPDLAVADVHQQA